MEKLSTEKRAAVLRCLVEGASIASTTRMTGTTKPCILKFLKIAGPACANFMDRMMRNLPCKTLQLDEVHGFVGCREKTKATAINEHPGEVWLWTCLCPDTKVIPAWRVGARDDQTAYDFCFDLSRRFKSVSQITSDGLRSYRHAVPAAFPLASFAQLVKIYGVDKDGKEIVVGARKITIQGNPDADLISTSLIERSNLTIRMECRRYTRRTNAFSREMRAHCNNLAVKFTAYNFTRRHQTLGTSPAVKAGIADHILSMEEIVEMIDAYQAAQTNAMYEARFVNLTPIPSEPTGSIPPAVGSHVPWYLDKDSGGPNPPWWNRKPSVKYKFNE